MKITTDIKEILEQGHFEGNSYYLPKNVERKLYMKCNDVLNSIGLVWTKGKKAHIANEEVENLDEILNEILETGEVETLKEYKKRFQFFPTPKEVAEYLVELADIQKDDIILEPSAGLGNIAELIPENLAITLIELDKNKYDIIANKFTGLNKLVLNMDFLEYNGGVFDKVIMNPPYSKKQDYKHIKKAIKLLDRGGRLVGLMSKGILFREDYKDLKEEIENHGYIKDLGEGLFKESGTMIGVCLVVYNK